MRRPFARCPCQPRCQPRCMRVDSACLCMHGAGAGDACLRCRYSKGAHTTDETDAVVQESHRDGRYFFGDADAEANECVDLSANGVCNEADRLPVASSDAFRSFDYEEFDVGDCPCGTDPTDCGERTGEDCGYATVARFDAEAHAGALEGSKVVPNDNSCRGVDIPPIMSFEVPSRLLLASSSSPPPPRPPPPRPPPRPP